MKFGISSINVGPQGQPDVLRRVVQAAERVGCESVWTYEHVLMPTHFASAYPYHPQGVFPGQAETPFVDPFVTLGFVAAETRSLRLATGINILTQANPLYFAKQAASVDVLSGGRLLLGVGAGWLRQEFDALGVPFARRGARMDEYLRALKAVWSEGEVHFHGEFVQWEGFQSRPGPVQAPHPPLIIGGHSRPALRRAARFGDGWFGFAHDRDVLAPLLDDLRAALAAEGRDPASLEISALWNHPWDGPPAVEQFAGLGVARLIVPLHRLDPDDPVAGVERFGNEVLARVS